jgi:hypothetical protein
VLRNAKTCFGDKETATITTEASIPEPRLQRNSNQKKRQQQPSMSSVQATFVTPSSNNLSPLPSTAATSTHPFSQDMTSSLSPRRPGDNAEPTPPTKCPADAPDLPPVDALITAEKNFTIPSTLAATTTSIHTSDVMERLTDLNISFDNTILERLFNPTMLSSKMRTRPTIMTIP